MDILRNRGRKECLRRSWGNRQTPGDTLQPKRTTKNAIQTAKDMVTVLSEKIKGVHFIYLEGNEVSSYRETKKEEWRTVRAFPGIQSWHVYGGV
ncbi:hypothetical protein HPB48_017534 [Haemaphysalis longicornis]|uniref:Uncharacterized protein n=1 Tax=Haemaphysalis longicornis TaxID=44386 RepID=A0A9J6FYF6_HAELO|nr:hypothetical protein HPB48_017534 [Haemaphysalis longicornis]